MVGSDWPVCTCAADYGATMGLARRLIAELSDDEDLIDETATRIWHLTPHGVEDFKGSYEEYEAAAASY